MAVPPFTVVNGDDGYQHHHHDDDDTSSMSSSTEKTNVTQQDNGDEADTTAPSSSTTTTTTTTPSLLSSLLPNKGSSSSSSSDNEALFSEDPSDQLYSAADWLHNIRSLPGSLILRDIRGPVLAVTGWAAVISVAHAALARRGVAIAAARLCLSDRPHGFLASALGLLLVFRTNSAYQRFAEARKLWEGILSTSRNLSRTVVLFERELGAARVRRILRLLATFPYALDEHVNHERWYERGTAEQARLRTLYEEANGNTNGDDGGGTTTSTDVLAVPRHVYQRRRGVHRRTVGSVRIRYIDTRTLPWCLLPDATRRKCAVAENRPLFVVDRLAREVMEARLTPNFTHRERSALLTMVDGLCSSMGACERIHQTAVPLNYARHALRCVSLWLFTLPLALVKDFGLGTAPVVMCLVRLFCVCFACNGGCGIRGCFTRIAHSVCLFVCLFFTTGLELFWYLSDRLHH